MGPRLGTCFMDSWSWMLDPECRHGKIIVMVLGFNDLTYGNNFVNGFGLATLA